MKTNNDIIKTLQKCQLFSGLGEDELGMISNLAEEKEYEAGATLFSVGEYVESLMVVKEGEVALQMLMSIASGKTSRKITVDILSANDLLGWSAFVEPYIYTLNALCLRPTKILSISGEKLRPLLNENQHIGYLVFKSLTSVVASRLDETRKVLVSERLLPPAN